MPWSLLICEERSAGLPWRRPGTDPLRGCVARGSRPGDEVRSLPCKESYEASALEALADSRNNESCALRIFLAETVPTLSTAGTGRAQRRF